MSLLDIAKKRYSVRKYEDKPVEKEKLEKILACAHVAPTAANLQPVKLLVVQDKERLKSIAKAGNIYNAPLAIIVCADHSKAWTRPFDNKQTTDIDASILTDHMMLQATELGLGTVWVCFFKPDVIKKEFQLPDNLEPINILAIGYGKGIDLPDNPEAFSAHNHDHASGYSSRGEEQKNGDISSVQASPPLPSSTRRAPYKSRSRAGPCCPFSGCWPQRHKHPQRWCGPG